MHLVIICNKFIYNLNGNSSVVPGPYASYLPKIIEEMNGDFEQV